MARAESLPIGAAVFKGESRLYHAQRMINLASLPCPVCGTSGSEIFHTTTYPEQRYPGAFTLRRCSTCSLLFNSPRLDDEGLARLYGGNYYFFLRSDDREFERIVGMYQRTVGMIAGAVTDRRCLDIGCGRGYFPAVLKELGWQASGVEISPDASEYARNQFGLDVFTGTIETYARSEQARTFPLVTAIDVIEHVPAPDEFVAAAARVVAVGGYLILDTPNAAAKNIETRGLAWKGFNPFHIYLFTIPNLTTLLERNGMRVEQSFSYGNTLTPRSMRDRAIGGLKAAGLAGVAASAYFGIKKRTVRQGDPDALVKKAGSKIQSAPAYTHSSDSGAELSDSKTGDNIVVIARKD